MNDNVRIMGVPFSKLSVEQTVGKLTDILDKPYSGKLFHLITGNPEIVIRQETDTELQRVIREADIITPDGIGIVIATRWKGSPVPERVTGYDLLIHLLKEGQRKKWSIYLLGASEETNQAAAETIESRYAGMRVAGRQHGFFGPDDEARIVADIAASGADLLVVAIGAPRAEFWINKYKDKLPVKVAYGVGGSLDVIAGKVKRAPMIWQKLNVEWLYRLLSQPSRWRRQLVLPVFAFKAFLDSRKR